MESKRLIRCIVVDDEHPAIRLLSGYIKRTPRLELILQTTSASEALEAINKGLADLVLLDIQMPEITGIQLMESLKNNHAKVILTTAYAEYALEGYKHDVIDYLLKPITFDRFLVAVAKAKQRIGTSSQQCSGYLMLRTEYKIQKTDFATILYIEGLGDYLIFYLTTGKLMTLERMKNMEQALPEECFVRIHKSYIVNISKIDYFEKAKIVISGQHLPVGDTFKSAVKLKLGW
ncbi:LytR/AlgR family response regulator transcription factor [Mucilaginibacter aquariorum]|uniref:LytTR family DNA-binding domain-containing protein n=1 Tax=Mucilaginibacter aquariorum TaxID=2967225 RepID=A0ABT1SVH8_9SPHI|nr:LytTR family DNA-binding domain-containing protein [Mucilaginibacter aquariorum]MCQ6956341.1 LytTR family DNA-binding domain-containing protein [Mucilaginibacter aquariorum]